MVTIMRTRRFAIRGATARGRNPKDGIKVWGAAAPGYYTGVFRSDGENTTLDATLAKEWVLIEGPGLRVLINLQRQAEFLEACHARGGAVG